MAQVVYTTKDNDVLDDILARYYGGSGVRAMNTVLVANPGLADKGRVYQSGTPIVLPDIPKVSITPVIRVWGAQ